MKKLQILGTGCPACETLAKRTEAAATDLNLDFQIEKVTAIDDILKFDILATPALVVDGQVKVSGRLPSGDEIKAMLGD